MTRSVTNLIAEALLRLPAGARRQLAQDATRRARAHGLVVVREAGDVDIPLTLTPETLTSSTATERGRDARAVLDGVLAAARCVFGTGLDSPLARRLFGHFGPLETQALTRWREAGTVSIARVDWFVDGAGRHRALELNATIPAMQAYSDAAARAWIEALGAQAGLGDAEVDRLVVQNGSNAEALRRSLLARGGFKPGSTPSIAIVHRENDSQLRELQALVRLFASAGHDVRLATPGDVRIDAGGGVLVGDRTYELLYRHIFARRMPEGSDLARIALGEARQELQNPVNGHLEVKGLFAELHRLIDEEDGRGLDLAEGTRERLSHVMPWTRLFGETVVRGPEGGRAPLVDLVRSEGARFVLKRSWDYGGKSVSIGRDVLAADGRAGWDRAVDAALAAGDGAFVVQELVDSPRHRHLVVGSDGGTTDEQVFVDASTYTSTGDEDVPAGSVARYARGGIVNIVGGGGVCPLVSDEVAAVIARRLGGDA
jgi:hypothetical protein